MTTIASFATISRNNDLTNPKISSVYILADSKLSWVTEKGKITQHQPNFTKVFIAPEIKSIFTFCGDGNNCLSLISGCMELLKRNKILRNPQGIVNFAVEIANIFDDFLIKIPLSLRIGTIRIYCVYTLDSKFYYTIYNANKSSSRFFFQFPEEIEVNQIDENNLIFADGSGGEKYKGKYIADKYKYKEVESSAVAFNSFYNFLEANVDPYTSLPMQGAIINNDGRVKSIAIKHKNEKFYLFGNEFTQGGNYSYEIDYRDHEFEFLHANGRIKGNNRKRYHFRETSK